jgi:adhesin transport system membrane fusion protein
MNRPHNVRYRQDADLMPEIQAASIRGPHRLATMMLWAVGVALILFFVWASLTDVDEVTKGEGRVISTGKNRVVQHLEGGIVDAILVKEGEVVKKGQVLLRVVNDDEQASYHEKRTEYLALLARAALLKAEAERKDKVVFPKEVLKEAPEIAQRERAAFASREKSFKQEIRTLTEELTQRQQSLKEQKSLIESLSDKVASQTTEIRAARKMVANHSMSKLELVRLERELVDVAGKLRTERLKLPRLQSAIDEARGQIAERRDKQIADVRKELNETRNKASVLREKIQAIRFRVNQTEVRSPVNGTIKSLRVSTKGGVVKGGEPLVEIVPLDDSLLIEAKVRPSDIAFLRTNQTALVKITAYSYAEYGGLEGKVVSISADTLKDDTGRGQRTFYRIRVRTNRNYLEKDGDKLPIVPGMTATVNIKTGQKSIFRYIFKPLTKTLTHHEAKS